MTHNHGYTTEQYVKNLVCRWHSQGGTDYEYLEPRMVADYDNLLTIIGDELDELYRRAFKLISENHKR